MTDDNQPDDDIFERNTGKDAGIGGHDEDSDEETEYGAVDAGFEDDRGLWDDVDTDGSDDKTPDDE